MSPTARRRTGDRGEALARDLLEQQGLRWIASNWHCAAGELDLVMQDREELVFVEVKTRRGESHGRAEESVTPAKGRRLLAAAEWFVAEHPDLGQMIWRIDLVAITLDRDGAVVRSTHLVNAIVAD